MDSFDYYVKFLRKYAFISAAKVVLLSDTGK